MRPPPPTPKLCCDVRFGATDTISSTDKVKPDPLETLTAQENRTRLVFRRCRPPWLPSPEYGAAPHCSKCDRNWRPLVSEIRRGPITLTNRTYLNAA
jgi:hypothetical protein